MILINASKNFWTSITSDKIDEDPKSMNVENPVATTTKEKQIYK